MAKTYKAKILGNDGIEMQTGKVRLSFPHLFEKYDKSEKFQCVLLIDKEDKLTIGTIKKAIEAAKEMGKSDKWGGKIPKDLDSPIHDGDNSDYDGYEDHYYLSAKSTRQPKVTDETGDEIFDQDDIYAGCYVRAVIKFLPYNNSGKGVCCILERIQKVDDGDPFGGSGGSDFEDEEEDDDDDLGLG